MQEQSVNSYKNIFTIKMNSLITNFNLLQKIFQLNIRVSFSHCLEFAFELKRLVDWVPRVSLAQAEARLAAALSASISAWSSAIFLGFGETIRGIHSA